MCNPSNFQRAQWAEDAVEHFGRATDMDTAGEDLETMTQDLLCNMMHLCDVEGFDFDRLLESARSCYQDELKES